MRQLTRAQSVWLVIALVGVAITALTQGQSGILAWLGAILGFLGVFVCVALHVRTLSQAFRFHEERASEYRTGKTETTTEETSVVSKKDVK